MKVREPVVKFIFQIPAKKSKLVPCESIRTIHEKIGLLATIYEFIFIRTHHVPADAPVVPVIPFVSYVVVTVPEAFDTNLPEVSHIVE